MEFLTAIKNTLAKASQVRKCRGNLIELCKKQGHCVAAQDAAITAFNALIANGHNHGNAINKALVAAEQTQNIINTCIVSVPFLGVRHG